MPLPNVNIIRLTGGLGRTGNDPGEGVGALCMGGVAVSGGAQLDTNHVLFSNKAAEDIGLDSAYDTSNNILVHYHISEFFRLNPTGELHVRLCAQGTTLTQMADKSLAFAKSLLVGGEGKVRKLGLVLNPAIGYGPILSGGLDEDAINAIPVAQALADDEYANDRPLNNIVVEGREFNGAVGAATDLRNLAGGPYRGVSVVIGQDPAVADGHAIHAKHAAVGAYLGAATNKEASQSFAQPISQFNLTSVADSRFLEVYISSNAALSSLDSADVGALHDKGYIFGRVFGGYDGAYFNQSFNCAPATDDYNASELRDVINRAVRLVRPVMIPLINSTQFPVDGGRIETGARRSVEADVRTALAAMDSDMSFPASDAQNTTVVVDPLADANGTPYASFLSDPTLRVIIGIVPKGKAEQIVVSIGYVSG